MAPLLDKALRQVVARDTGRKFNMLLFGPPGVGKGTFAKLIQQDFNVMPFSTGDYFRAVIKLANEGGSMDSFSMNISEILKSG
jgi:adenylate kinase family enzyme